MDVILDTNIFVAAGFNPRSDAARVVEAIREGRLALIWNAATRAESRTIVEQIPPLNWQDFADLFDTVHEFTGETHPDRFGTVEDRDDRKFAALAAAAGAVLISNDHHLLAVRPSLGIRVMTPQEFVQSGALASG